LRHNGGHLTVGVEHVCSISGLKTFGEYRGEFDGWNGVLTNRAEQCEPRLGKPAI
jgi:hypothetical protein